MVVIKADVGKICHWLLRMPKRLFVRPLKPVRHRLPLKKHLQIRNHSRSTKNGLASSDTLKNGDVFDEQRAR